MRQDQIPVPTVTTGQELVNAITLFLEEAGHPNPTKWESMTYPSDAVSFGTNLAAAKSAVCTHWKTFISLSGNQSVVIYLNPNLETKDFMRAFKTVVAKCIAENRYCA